MARQYAEARRAEPANTDLLADRRHANTCATITCYLRTCSREERSTIRRAAQHRSSTLELGTRPAAPHTPPHTTAHARARDITSAPITYRSLIEWRRPLASSRHLSRSLVTSCDLSRPLATPPDRFDSSAFPSQPHRLQSHRLRCTHVSISS